MLAVPRHPAAAPSGDPALADRLHESVARRPVTWCGSTPGAYELDGLVAVRALDGRYLAEVGGAACWFDEPDEALAWGESISRAGGRSG